MSNFKSISTKIHPFVKIQTLIVSNSRYYKNHFQITVRRTHSLLHFWQFDETIKCSQVYRYKDGKIYCWKWGWKNLQVEFPTRLYFWHGMLYIERRTANMGVSFTLSVRVWYIFRHKSSTELPASLLINLARKSVKKKPRWNG